MIPKKKPFSKGIARVHLEDNGKTSCGAGYKTLNGKPMMTKDSSKVSCKLCQNGLTTSETFRLISKSHRKNKKKETKEKRRK